MPRGRKLYGKEKMQSRIWTVCDQALHDEVQALAARENRTVSTMSRLLVLEALEARKRREPPPAAPTGRAERAH